MSIAYNLKKEIELAIVVWDGEVTFTQWMENSKQITTDPNITSTSMQVVDLRFASIDPSISENEFQEIINYLSLYKQLFSGRKIAVIADEEFGRATVFKHMAQTLGVSFIVFNDLLIACHWLGVDAGIVEQEIERLRAQLRQAGKV